MKIFFTYVWGAPGNPAFPLTFANKAARRHARNNVAPGDLVFTVCTKGKPTDPALWGQVAGVYRVSALEINTADYNLPTNERNPEFDNTQKFPYALHPLEVWEVDDPDNKFSDLVGPLKPGDHWQAQSRLLELSGDVAAPLLSLKKHKVAPMEPATEFGKGIVKAHMSKLAPKHEGEFRGKFSDPDVWYTYLLVLRDQKKKALAVKVGYSSKPKEREAAYKSCLAAEVSGLDWVLEFQQPLASEDAARELEQSVLAKYESHRLPSNGEILHSVDPFMIAAEMGVALRDC